MKRILLYTASVFLLFAAASCNRAEREEVGPSDIVDLGVSTRALSPSVMVRIMVASATDGLVVLNRYPVAPDQTTDEYGIKLPSGKYNFFIIGNEPGRLTPVLNGITRQSQLFGLEIRAGELPAVESPIGGSDTDTNIPIFGTVAATVRPSAEGNGKGEVSVDNGATWSGTLDMTLQRLATKIFFSMRKNTNDPNDKVTVRKIELVNVPAYGHLLAEAYGGTDYGTFSAWSNPSGYEFSQNSATAISFFSDLILPEYIMADPADMNMAAAIKVTAEYNYKEIQYHIPLRGLDAADYSLRRNNHYMIIATIRKAYYLPEISYQVGDWFDAVDDPNFIEEKSIQYESHWAAGTSVNTAQRTAFVEGNGCLEYSFTLNHPLSATWAATITNPIDFMFDYSDGAVSSGKAMQGVEYKIRIKPRRETSLNNIKTEFFITVNTGLENVELNLPAAGTGSGNRYTIIQIPN